jgi:undecaprenyl diphosphate synthase
VDTDVSRLTLYAFSSDNWRRPASEVQSIFWLLRAFLRLEAQRLRQRGVRLRVIGRRDRLAKSVLREIDNAEHATASGHRLDLRVAIDYSSRDAITHAAAGMMAGISNEGPTSPDSLDTLLKKAMTEQYGDVDLLIRTGGEKRLSDFLLWECAYAELLFTDRMWPDFDGADLDDALNEFRRRERRFGGLPAIALSQTVLPNGHLDALTSH